MDHETEVNQKIREQVNQAAHIRESIRILSAAKMNTPATKPGEPKFETVQGKGGVNAGKSRSRRHQ